MSGNTMTKVASLAFVFLLVSSSMTAGLMAMTETAKADVGTQGDCTDDAIGLVTGTAVTLYSNIRDPCWETSEVNADTDEEAKRQIAQQALENKRQVARYFEQFDSNTQKLENPALSDAKLAFVNAQLNGSTETEAVTDAREAVHNRTAAQQRSLWLDYRGHVDSIATLEAEEDDNNVSVINVGYVDPDTGEFVTGYSVQDWSDKGATANLSLTDGSQIEVPVAYKTDSGGNITDTINPRTQNLLITVYNPESGQNETVVNTADLGSEQVVGPDAGVSNGTVRNFTEQDETFAEAEFKASDAGSTSWGGVFFRTEQDGSNIRMALNPSDGNVQIAERDGGWFSSSVQSSSGSVADNSAVFFNAEVNSDGTTTFTAVDTSGNQVAEMTLDVTVEEIVVFEQDNDINVGQADVFVDSDYQPGTYVNEFGTRDTTLENVDNEALDALGNSSSGYLHTVDENLDTGAINASEILTGYDRYRTSVEPGDVGERSWRTYQYRQLGYSGPSSTATVEIKVLAGSTVDGTEISENQTFSGQIFIDSQPPEGNWTAGETYNVSVSDSSKELNSTLFIQHSDTESIEEDGTITYKTVGKTEEVTEGEIKIVGLTNDNGTTVTTLDHNDNEPTNITDTSEITSELKNLRDTLENLRDQIDEDNDGDTVDGALSGSSIDGLEFAGFELPFSFAQVSVFAVVIIGLVAAVVVRSYIGLLS